MGTRGVKEYTLTPIEPDQSPMIQQLFGCKAVCVGSFRQRLELTEYADTQEAANEAAKKAIEAETLWWE